MEEDRDDIVELDVPPPPPPRLEVQPDSDPPAEEHDPFAQIFPPILRAERPKLPRSIRTYTSTFMDRDSFMDQFKDTPSLFTPPAMDRAFNPSLVRTLESSTDYYGLPRTGRATLSRR
jgi:hypothetical protein